MNSQELFARSQQVSPGGVHSPVRAFKSVGGTPIFFSSAEGAYLTSVEGKKYIDFCQSFGPNILGHRDPDVQKSVLEILDKAWSFGACEPYSLELAEWMKEQVPFLDKLRFVSSGTEAVMSALRVARAATGRDKILKFDGCYHGHVDSLLVKAGSGLAGEASSDSAGVSEQTAHQTLVTALDDEEAYLKTLNDHKDQIAAVILEPLPANFGLLAQRKEFIDFVVNEAKQRGILVIFDEVISGFRMAFGGMAELLDIKPDLVTYGKVIGGGFPVGCYGGREDLMNLVAPAGRVYQAGTLSANPVGMVAGLTTLKKMKEVQGHKFLKERTERMTSRLNEIFQAHQVPMQVSSQGSLFWIHPKSDKPIRRVDQIPTQHGENFKKFFSECLNEGVYLAPSGYEVGFLSLAHTDEIIDSALEKFSNAAKKVFG
ncbi:MAG: aspartate aminotransferase family protein [Bdellovibrionaceae bacterium]|nr:aspartate aminotransferase family protein [Pseudobdellovibrionaceae bacterium]|tara:strand:- start:6018 stop:7301 length:1284 start_codon:yes stop_codon:yes gene_type:complete